MVKKLTKNKKKTWRKIDVHEVDEHLEDERLKERLGPIDSRISFSIDTEPARPEQPVKQQQVSRKRVLKTTEDLTSDLKCFQTLTSRSKVAAMRPRPGPKAKTPSVKKKNPAPAIKALTPIADVSPYDLWSEVKADERDELVEQQLKLVGKNKVKVPSSAKQKPNLVPAVPLPEAGFSYNPSQSDYQSLISKVVRKEVSRGKAEQRINRSVTMHFQSKSHTQLEHEYMAEMTQGLAGAEDPENSDEEKTVVRKNPMVRAENRKTRAQRNKQMRVKRMMEETRRKRDQIKRAKQPMRLAKMIQEMKEQESEREKRQKVRRERQKSLLLQPKEKVMQSLPDEPIPGPADLTRSLRRVKVVANHLEDRFKSIVGRSLVEAPSTKRRKHQRQLPARKLYVKRSHATQQ